MMYVFLNDGETFSSAQGALLVTFDGTEAFDLMEILRCADPADLEAARVEVPESVTDELEEN